MNYSDSHSAIERGKRVKRLRNLANIDRKNACASGGFSIATLKNWELGRYGGINDIGAKKILQVVKKEGVEATYEWLMFGLGSSPKLIPGFEDKQSHFSSKKDCSLTLAEEETQILREISIFKDYYHDIVHFCIPDSSMNPIYQKGDYVAGIKILPEELKTKEISSLKCITKLKTGEVFVRLIKSIDKKYEFCFCNTGLENETEKLNIHASDIVYIAPIIRHYKKIKNF